MSARRWSVLLLCAAFSACGGDGGSSGDAEVFVDADGAAEVSLDADADSAGDTDVLADADAVADADSAGDADVLADADAVADAETSGDADAALDADAPLDADTSTDSVTDADGASDADTLGDADADAGPDVVVVAGPDHTVNAFASAAEFFAFSSLGVEPVQGKFILTDFSSEVGGLPYFLDSTFYELHDEWYWFRLLSGLPIAGLDVQPVEGYDFESIAEIYAAFAGQSNLPLDLKFLGGGRLYSPKFYDLGLWKEPRFFGLGSILHYPANPKRVLPEALWLFELEFSDDKVTEAMIVKFFERLDAALPPEIGSNLRWLVRSIPQDTLGSAIEAGNGPYKDRIVRYSDLVVEGEVVGYNDGIAAGKVKRVPAGGAGASSMGPEHIVVLAEVPDFLPPVAGIVTAVPQTPLAHLNLLAKSRGTPNAYVAGVLEDPAIESWADFLKPVIVEVKAGQVRWKEITQTQYDKYKSLLGVNSNVTITQIDIANAPYVVELTEGLAGLADAVPLIGGKAAGLMGLMDFAQVLLPDVPIALSIRGYYEHIAPIRDTLEALLVNASFDSSERTRFLLLEGYDEFEAAHAKDAPALTWLAGFMAQNGPQTFLGGIVSKGGVKEMIRDLPLAPATLQTYTSALSQHYAHFSPLQGLRFRSSSTAEDIEGFNGAGLYDSNTGFFDPSLQPDKGDKKKTLSYAILKTWASYWTFEAFEERRAAGIAHLSGNMALAVHPRFDDPDELANGVITVFIARNESGGDRVRMVINVQDGALSVTNPEPGNPALPEVDVVERYGSAPATITRAQSSTEVPDGTWILTDAELYSLLDTLNTVSDAWLDQKNTALPAPQQRSTLILDLELKRMAAGWPELAQGSIPGPRIILKQARTLDNPILVTGAILDWPIPRDILERMQRIETRKCTAGSLRVWSTETFTRADDGFALDFELVPFASSVVVEILANIPQLGLTQGAPLVAHHLEVDITHPAMTGPSDWDLQIVLPPTLAAMRGYDTVRVKQGGAWSIAKGQTVVSGQGTLCDILPQSSSAGAYLESLMPPK
ncbi:MAG: hypothetical protein R3F39_16140 [Myxococcota bacterium]